MSKRILGLANSVVTSCLYPFTSLRGIFCPNGVKGKSSHSSCLSSLGKGRCRFSASLSLSHVFCLPKDAQTRMNFGGSCWGREGSWLSVQAQGRRAWSDKGTVIRGGRRKSFSLVTPWLRSAQKKKFRVFLNWITSISQNPRNKTKQISLEWELQPRISCLPADPSPQSLQAREDRVPWAGSVHREPSQTLHPQRTKVPLRTFVQTINICRDTLGMNPAWEEQPAVAPSLPLLGCVEPGLAEH